MNEIALLGSGKVEFHAGTGVLKKDMPGMYFQVDFRIMSDDCVCVSRHSSARILLSEAKGGLPLKGENWNAKDIYDPFIIHVGEKFFFGSVQNNDWMGVLVTGIHPDKNGSGSLNYDFRIYHLEQGSGLKQTAVSSNVTFRTRARLLNQLGEQLIKNEGVALLELVKNSYDADATICKVSMISPTDMERGSIIIEDDGCGMSLEVVQNAWLEIGTDNKIGRNGKSTRTQKFGRSPLGEKGIGRFGVHRLGRVVDLVTKSRSDDDEIHVRIDWSCLDDSDYVENIPVLCERRTPVCFVGNATGTRIEISRFRSSWTKRGIVDAARAIGSLNSPFLRNDSFRAFMSIVDDPIAESYLSTVVSFEDICDSALFAFDITMRGAHIVHYKYEFRPWPAMERLSPKTIEWSDENVMAKMVYPRKDLDLWNNLDDAQFAKMWPIDISEIGEVRFAGLIFDLDAKLLNLGVQDKKGLKQYLKANCGVRVYRDNMRVLDYGEPGNDWLGINDRKFGRSASHIGNSSILAAVYLSRDASSALLEKSNREGFLDNNAYRTLCAALNFCLDRLDGDWVVDKNILRKMYAPRGAADATPVQTPILELRDAIQSARGLSAPDKERILRCVEKINSDYDSVVDNLIKSAGAGLNLILVMHQMEKIVSAINRAVMRRADVSMIESQLTMLKELLKGYSIMVRSSDKKLRDLLPIIRQSVFNAQFRFLAHKIQIDKPYETRDEALAICSEGHVVNALLNLFDNSIWWLGYARTEEASLFIDVSDSLKGYTTIVVADNGPGFTKPTSEIVKPFVTDKPGGMGIGLHLTAEIMKSLGGKLLFPPPGLFDVPRKYRKGAIVALAFVKEVPR